MSTETYEGMTFVSSMRGWRYDRAKQNILLAVFASWIFFDDYFQRGELDWQGPAIMLLVWAVMSWPMRGFNKRRVFRSQVTIGEDHLDVVDAGVSARIPWRDSLYIRIDRSLSGHRRNFRFRHGAPPERRRFLGPSAPFRLATLACTTLRDPKSDYPGILR